MADSGWEVVSAIAAAVSSAAAATQLYWSRIDANRRQTLSLLADLSGRLDAVNTLDVHHVRHSVLNSYRTGVPLTADGARYLAFVHAVELIADAREHGGVDNAMTDRFLKSFVHADTIPLSFLSSLQQTLGDEGAYSQTRKLFSRYATSDVNR